MKVLKFVFYTVFFLAIVIAGLLHRILKLNFVTKLTYHDKEITISRGQHNIPQIHAHSLESALYSWGYTTAQDRLFQLALRRETIKGRLSQYFGNRMLEVDKMFRELNFPGSSQKSATTFQKQNITQYNKWKAFAQGINDFQKTLSLPQIQFILTGIKWEPWTVTDTISIYKLLKWSLSYGITDQYMRSSLLGDSYKLQQIQKILPFQQKHWLNQNIMQHTTIVKQNQLPKQHCNKSHSDKDKFKPVPVKKLIPVQKLQQHQANEKASNSWVISGKYTQSGHPLICNDPHLQTALPGQWYQVKIFYPDPIGPNQLYLIGASMVGVPIIVGKSSYVSIALTMNFNDIEDLYKQQIQGEQYLLDGKWKPLTVRTQIINIKGQKPLQYKVYETHRGPLIKHLNFKGYLYVIPDDISLRWTGFSDNQYVSLSQLVHIAQVKKHQDLLDALADQFDSFPPINLLYSTKDDHIGFYSLGKFPLRSHPHMGMFVQDGTKSENDWIGCVKGKDRLHLSDPQRGYITTANNKAAPNKYYDGLFDISIFTSRAARIENLIRNEIKSGRKLNKLFMRDLQLDTVDGYCLEIVKNIKSKLTTHPTDYQFYNIFNDFDCNFATNSTISSVYLVYMQNVYEELNPSIQNQTYNLGGSHHLHQYIYHYLLKDHHTQQQLIKLNNAMTDTLNELKAHFKTSDVKLYNYGQLHRDVMIHRPFSKVQLFRRFVQHESPGFGNLNTINVGLMMRYHSKEYATNHRAGLRLIMSYYQDSEWAIDGGSSQKCYSHYYKDQTSTFLSGGYFLMDPANRTQHVY